MAGWDVIGLSGWEGEFVGFQGLVEVVGIFECVVIIRSFFTCSEVFVMADTSWVQRRIASREGPGLISPV